MTAYPPLFKRIPMEPNNDIPKLQHEFEKFWRSISPMIEKNPEKTQGMRKLQEACMWFTRAIAISNFKPDTSNFNQSGYNPMTKGPIASGNPQKAPRNMDEYPETSNHGKPHVKVMYRSRTKYEKGE